MENNSRQFAMLVAPGSKIYIIDVTNESFIFSYLEEHKKIYDLWRNNLVPDYLDIGVDDDRDIILYRYQYGNRQLIPWTSNVDMQSYIIAHFGYGAEVSSSNEYTVFLDMSGKRAQVNETHYFEISKTNYKIYTTHWRLEFSKFQASYIDGDSDATVDVYHAFDVDAFDDFCSAMGVGNLDEIDYDIWLHRMASGRIEIGRAINVDRKVYHALSGEDGVVVKKLRRDHIFTPTCLKLWKINTNDNIRGLRGAQIVDDAYEIVFDHCEYTLFDFLFVVAPRTISQQQPLHWLNVFRGIVNGLEYLHGEVICHTNLNPWNILVTTDAVTKIGGFTNAKELNQTLVGSDLSALGKLIVFCHSPQLDSLFEESYADLRVLSQDMYAWAYEAKDIATRLLNPRDNVTLDDVSYHPWLWWPEYRIQFINDACQFLANQARKHPVRGYYDNKMKARKSSFFSGNKWASRVPQVIMLHMRSFGPKGTPYHPDCPRHLLKFVRNFTSHMPQILNEMQNYPGTYGYNTVDAVDALCSSSWYPKLVTGVYNFIRTEFVDQNHQDVAAIRGYYP